MIRTRGVSVKGLARALLLTTLKLSLLPQRQSCADLRGRWGSSLPRLRDRPEWPAELACPSWTPSLGSERAADPPQPRPRHPGGMEAGRRPSSPSSPARRGTCSLARPADLSKTGSDGNCHPWSVLRVIKQHAFYTAIGKGVKTGACGPGPLGLRAQHSEDYLWLSTLLSHTSNSVLLRTSICWPLLPRL